MITKIKNCLVRTTSQLKNDKKIFVIGFNKSASTSFDALFESYGLTSYHGPAWRSHRKINFMRKYQCFSDGTPRDLIELDYLFPNSKFILNVRELNSWILSRLAHIERKKKEDDNYPTTANWDNTEQAIKEWVKERNSYHLFALSYFSDRPKDLLCVNYIRDDLAATKVAKFLGYENHHSKPHKNQNPKSAPLETHKKMIKNCIKELGIPEKELQNDIYCPSITPTNLIDNYPEDTLNL